MLQNTFSKKEKLLLGFFLGLFIVPEVMWGVVVNTIGWFVNGRAITLEMPWTNLLMNQDSSLYIDVVSVGFVEFVGISLSLLFFFFKRRKVVHTWTRWTIIFFLVTLTITAFFAWDFLQYLTTGPSWQLVQ